jgi:aryl-alcohol dehydrogenase-like predicted oxidoreductase
VHAYLDERGRRIVDAVATAAEGLGASPGEVALAWLRDRPGVVAPVLGARTAQQLAGALAADELVLPDEIVQALDDVSAPGLGYPESGWAQRR